MKPRSTNRAYKGPRKSLCCANNRVAVFAYITEIQMTPVDQFLYTVGPIHAKRSPLGCDEAGGPAGENTIFTITGHKFLINNTFYNL